MENLVLYRKYRPKSFAEVVGQKHAVATLTHALANDKTAHAYLFCGPRGTGKTTIARLLAKAVNCESPKQKFEPCNKCDSCRQINEGRSLDLVEIDAASNRGIDEIRELREGIKFSPVHLKFKVFIIDEVHMLTREAFNALLKTLEEPPAHAIFILATTETHKVPQTIISRCQRFDFHKLNLDEISGQLAFVADKEGVKISKEALSLIAANADGALRDAESLLGQVMALEDKNITLEEVQLILGIVDFSSSVEMADFIIRKDLKGALILINKLSEQGSDLAQFAKSLTSYFRKMMILASFIGTNDAENYDSQNRQLVAPELTREQFKVILEQGKKLVSREYIKILKSLAQAEFEIKSAVLPQLPLELAVVELTGE